MFPGYRDATLVGEGGLGRVYRAVRISTGGEVAIKELRDISEGSPAWHRARRELEALLRLKGHPHVVSVEEIIDGPTGPALVMEYLPGGSLGDRVESGPLTSAELVFVGDCVANALSAAHEAGIVHRDIKPHNLLVSGFGQVKVCDFGISALTRTEGGRTQTKAMTLAYASPEEIDGDDDVGPPADVYSFSATLLHCLTGRRPTFRDRISGEWTSPDGLHPSMDAPVELIRLGLSHDPVDRPTIAQFSAAFYQAAVDLGAERVARLGGTRPRVAAGQDLDGTVIRADRAVVDGAVLPVVQADGRSGAHGNQSGLEEAETLLRGSEPRLQTVDDSSGLDGPASASGSRYRDVKFWLYCRMYGLK